jgi:hypothetical protein
MSSSHQDLFGEAYRVLEVDGQSLTIQGVKSGKVRTILNPNPEDPLSARDYPPGKLIALSDPSNTPES